MRVCRPCGKKAVLVCLVVLLTLALCVWLSRNAFYQSNLYRNIELGALKGIQHCGSSSAERGELSPPSSRECSLQKLPSVAGVTIVTFASSGWSNLLNNWLCSLKRVGLDEAVYIIAFGDGVCPSLSSSKVACKSVENAPPAARYGEQGYQKILQIRTREILHLLDCGHTILVTDADVVFLKDPLPKLSLLSENKDMLFQGDSVDHEVADSLIPYVANYACLGFMYLKPTPGTSALWTGVYNYQMKFYWNDQAAVNVCLRHPSLIMSVKWSVLDYWQFPNGIQVFKRKASIEDAFIVHTNFIMGDVNKAAEMMAANVWCYAPAIADTCHNAYKFGCVNRKPAKTWCDGLTLYCRQHGVHF